jgi:hypothetical protein
MWNAAVHKPQRLVCLLVSGMIMTVGSVACTQAPSVDQVQALVATRVAGTVAAQNQIGTAVALTVSAMAPAAAAAASSTTAVPEAITTTPVVSTLTPFGAPTKAARKKPDYACDVKTRPYDRTAFKPGDAFDIKWTITNTGAKTWAAGKGLDYMSGPQLTSHGGVELPEMEPGDTFSFSADANAPLDKGFYVMSWKVEGGFCFPYVAIVSGRPGDP